MRGYVFQAVMTPGEEGGYDVIVPDLPGCLSYGDTCEQAAFEIADAMRTYVAALLRDGRSVPSPIFREVEPPEVSLIVHFETDESYLVEGEVVSAAEASRRLGISAGRVTHLLDAGLLDGYRRGRRTYVTVESIARRKASAARAGRPRKKANA